MTKSYVLRYATLQPYRYMYYQPNGSWLLDARYTAEIWHDGMQACARARKLQSGVRQLIVTDVIYV